MRDPLQFVLTGQLGHVFTLHGSYVTTVVLLEHRTPENHQRESDPTRRRVQKRRATSRWYERMMADPTRAEKYRAKKRMSRQEKTP